MNIETAASLSRIKDIILDITPYAVKDENLQDILVELREEIDVLESEIDG